MLRVSPCLTSLAQRHWPDCRVQYGKVLESSTFNNNTADFLWMLMFGAGAMLVSALPSLGMHDAHDASVARSQQRCLMCGTLVTIHLKRIHNSSNLSEICMHHQTFVTKAC